MDLRKFLTNPYIEKIYDSFRGEHSVDEYAALLKAGISQKLGNNNFEVLGLEGGVGLALQLGLSDKSRVHVKVLKGLESFAHQEACCAVQNYLAANGFPCTVPIGTPARFLDCSLQLEEYNITGEYRDSHEPEVMKL